MMITPRRSPKSPQVHAALLLRAPTVLTLASPIVSPIHQSPTLHAAETIFRHKPNQPIASRTIESRDLNHRRLFSCTFQDHQYIVQVRILLFDLAAQALIYLRSARGRRRAWAEGIFCAALMIAYYVLTTATSSFTLHLAHAVKVQFIV